MSDRLRIIKRHRTHLLILLLAIAVWAIAFRNQLRAQFSSVTNKMTGEKTVADRLSEFGDVVHARLDPCFREIGVAYPPKKLVVIATLVEPVAIRIDAATTSQKQWRQMPVARPFGNGCANAHQNFLEAAVRADDRDHPSNWSQTIVGKAQDLLLVKSALITQRIK